MYWWSYYLFTIRVVFLRGGLGNLAVVPGTRVYVIGGGSASL